MHMGSHYFSNVFLFQFKVSTIQVAYHCLKTSTSTLHDLKKKQMPVVKKKCIHCRTAKLYSYISSTRLWSSIWHHPKILVHVRPKDWAGDTPQTVSKLYCKFGSHNHYIPCLAHCNDLLLYYSECLIFFFSSVE